jgi:hypothetical protein
MVELLITRCRYARYLLAALPTVAFGVQTWK